MKKIQSKVVGVHNNKDFIRNDRVKWLKQLYAEWLAKRNLTLNNKNETYQIIEPEELESEGYWEVMSKELGKVIRY
jgi:hypothetical protein